MRNSRTLLLASLLLLAAAVIGSACWGGDGSKNGNAPQDLANIPTATPPAQTPEARIVGQSEVFTGDTYAVQDGDTLSSIAEQFDTSVEALMEANELADATSLSVGQVLRIPSQPGNVQGATPSPQATEEPSPEEPTATEEPSSGGEVYVVQNGDIPETIAAQFGITADQLMAANGITDPASLQVGQELVIPTPEP